MAVCPSFLYLVSFLFRYVSVTLKSKNWLRSGLFQRHTTDFTNAMTDASNNNNMRESLHKYRIETVNHKLPGT